MVDVSEAAERLRNPEWWRDFDAIATQEGVMAQQLADLRRLADAYLAEHPRDNVTTPQQRAELVDELKSWVNVYGDMHLIPWDKLTRGTVQRLLDELKEPNTVAQDITEGLTDFANSLKEGEQPNE